MLNQPRLLEIENRNFARHKCHWPAVLMTETFNHSCIIEDIGIGGCRLLVNTCNVSPGMEVTVQVPMRDLVFRGLVVWSNYEEAGLKFISKPEKPKV